MQKFNSFSFLQDLKYKQISLYDYYREMVNILGTYANMSSICRKLGFSPQSVNAFIKGNDKALSLNKLELLVTFLDSLPCGLTDEEVINLKKDLEIK